MKETSLDFSPFLLNINRIQTLADAPKSVMFNKHLITWHAQLHSASDGIFYLKVVTICKPVSQHL